MGSFIHLATADGTQVPAYVAQPATPAKAAVVVIQEIFGVNAHIREVADAYAREGYLAIAPAMFHRVQANVELGFKSDLRDYGIGAQILRALGLKKLRIITNNPSKYIALAGYGLEIVERIPLEIVPNKVNLQYMKTKKEKMGHILTKVK